MRCPKCSASENQIDNYDFGEGLILVCLICGEEWTQGEADEFYADGSKIKELPF